MSAHPENEGTPLSPQSGHDVHTGQQLDLPRFDPAPWLEAPEPARGELIQLEVKILRARHRIGLAQNFIRRLERDMGPGHVSEHAQGILSTAERTLSELLARQAALAESAHVEAPKVLRR